MRLVKFAVVTVVLAGMLTVVAVAQAPVPTVAVTAAKGSITLTPSGPIAAGPTRFEVSRSGKGEVQAFVATLRAGVTVDELSRTLKRNADEALGLVFLEAAATPAGPSARAVTVNLRPNLTYVAISIAGRSSAVTSFSTGAASAASAPAPDARIRMVDYGFKGPKTLPRNGSVRVQNAGAAFHFALAIPLRPGTRTKQVARAFGGRGGGGADRIIAGAPLEVQGLISPGTTNDNEVRFPRKGRYAFVCFFGEHNRLGMYKVFKVR